MSCELDQSVWPSVSSVWRSPSGVALLVGLIKITRGRRFDGEMNQLLKWAMGGKFPPGNGFRGNFND